MAKFKFPYQQQYKYMKKLVQAGKSYGYPKEVVTALAVNAYHESYINPYTIEGAINPGPPLGANGIFAGDGVGLWQWTTGANNPVISHLGDFDWQVKYLHDYKQQWIGYGTWFQSAGVPDPTPKLGLNYDEFLYNKYGYNDTQLTQAFIGYWERPNYQAGAVRYNNAPTEAPQFRELVDEYWGGGSNPGNPNEGSPGGGGTGNNNKPNDETSITEATKKLIQSFLKYYQDALKKDIYINVNNKNGHNNDLILTQKFPNIYQNKTTSAFDKALQKAIDDAKEKTPQKPSPNPNDTGAEKPPKPGGGGGGDNNKTYTAILNWCKANLGKSYNIESAHPGAGAQCVDLIKYINIYVLDRILETNLSNGNAQDLYPHDLTGTGWKHVKGDSLNDANAVKIWNSLPNGCIVYFNSGVYGHVAIKAGDAMDVYEQNYAGRHYITHDNIYSWVHSGAAGFMGAWVLE